MTYRPHATYAALASAHRVHAGYAKAERANSALSIATWTAGTAAFGYLAIADPGIGRVILLILGVLGFALTIYFRHEAGKRYERHALAADKYKMLAEQTRRYDPENR